MRLLPLLLSTTTIALTVTTAHAANTIDADSATITAIEATCFDYIDGQLEGNPQRVARSLHPDLAKRAAIGDTPDERLGLRRMSKEELVNLTKEGALKTRISSLLERCGFHSEGIFIMDGSKRSGHGNAYFTGLGENKRIVFYDNLVASLDDEELEGVLAHELGHFKCKHVIKMLIASSISMFIGFAILGWMIDKEWFFAGLGVHQASNAAALLLFTLIAPIFTFFMKPISAYFQRKFEFEADDFAAQHAQASKLVSALVKLYEENASTLTPDPFYASFYYSHPPAAIRIAHLEKSANRKI